VATFKPIDDVGPVSKRTSVRVPRNGGSSEIEDWEIDVEFEDQNGYKWSRLGSGKLRRKPLPKNEGS
jgi:hypothetical protein